MSICFVNRFALTKTTLVFAAIVALAPVAYPSTISSFSISTDASGGTPCSVSGSGPGTASCHSSDGINNQGDAGVTLTDNSLQLSVSGNHAGGGSAFASVTHDDFYSVPVNGPVSALLSLTCDNGFHPVGTICHFSLGSTTVSPPVESIWAGASQGSGPCGTTIRLPGPPYGIFVVSLSATNNIVHLHTYIDGNVGSTADIDSAIFVQLTVNGFQDANGNSISARLLPEPGTLGTFALALLVGVGTKAIRKLPGLSGHN
jgi:hypothetical protein